MTNVVNALQTEATNAITTGLGALEVILVAAFGIAVVFFIYNLIKRALY